MLGADGVSRGWIAKLSFDAVNDIQVSQSRLYHENVSPFLHVESHLAQRLAGIARIHLIAAAIAELWGRFGSFAERTVKGGGKFGSVGHDGCIAEALAVQFLTNSPHPAVHHIARGHHVRTGLDVTGGCFRKQLESRIIEDPRSRGFAFNYPAMPVRHVLTQADIRNYQQIRQFLFKRAHRLLNKPASGIRARSAQVLGFRDAEQQHRRHTGFESPGGFLYQFIHRKLTNTWHGVDRPPNTPTRPDKQRKHQLARTQLGFTNETPQRDRLPQAPRPGARERRDWMHTHDQKCRCLPWPAKPKNAERLWQIRRRKGMMYRTVPQIRSPNLFFQCGRRRIGKKPAQSNKPNHRR